MLSLGHVMPALALTPANQSTEPSPRKLRSKDRAAQWRRDLEQRTGALLKVSPPLGGSVFGPKFTG